MDFGKIGSRFFAIVAVFKIVTIILGFFLLQSLNSIFQIICRYLIRHILAIFIPKIIVTFMLTCDII